MPKGEGYDYERGSIIDSFSRSANKTPDVNPNCGLPKGYNYDGPRRSCAAHINTPENIMSESSQRFINPSGEPTKEGKLLSQCINRHSCILAQAFGCLDIFK